MGDAYAPLLETVAMGMVCVANMKTVEAKNKLFFIRNQSNILVQPNKLMVVSLNLVYFSLPLAIAYVQGQQVVIISAT